MMKRKFKIGDLREVIPGTTIWSIALQERVIVQDRLIVKIDATCHNDAEHAFVKSQLILYEYGGIPGISDKTNGEYGTINILKDTKPYKLLQPAFINL